MIKVTTQVIRFEDSLMCKFVFTLDMAIKSKSMTIEFWDGEHSVDIATTTVGYIQRKKITIDQPKQRVEVCIPYLDHQIECRVAYLDEDDLVKSETLQIEPEKVSSVEASRLEPDFVPSDGENFSEQMTNLPDTLKERGSAWNLKLTASSNIVVEVLKSGPEPIKAAFGDGQHEVTSSDFIFTLYPNQKNFVIPAEVILKFKKNYRGLLLGVSELVEAGFHRIPNVYYKSPISNFIHGNRIKSENHSLSNFRTPDGETFGENWIVQNDLPVWKEHED